MLSAMVKSIKQAIRYRFWRAILKLSMSLSKDRRYIITECTDCFQTVQGYTMMMQEMSYLMTGLKTAEKPLPTSYILIM